MKIRFTITNVPVGYQKHYPTAYVEGNLTIYFREICFLNQPGILLIEFAIIIDKWLVQLREGKFIDFVYESMDNIEPILSINHSTGNFYRMSSCWQESEILELLTVNVIVDAFEKYLYNLGVELKSLIGIDLRKILNYS